MATDNKNKVLNVPHLRFPEFGGEWRKYKLAEICSFFSGGTPSSSKKEYYDGNIPFIRSGELHMDKTELFITEVGLDNSAAKIVDVGDLLLALYGATSGDIAISQIKGAINQAILCIRTTQNKKFIESVWKKHVEKLLQTYLQGGQGNLSADIVKNISFYFAESNEQIKLAKFITLLDERIATQNKIIEKQQSLIKGLAAQLTQSGIPNVRLCDCLECHSSTLQEDCVSATGSYPVYGATGLIGYTNNYAYNGESILIVKDGSSVGSLSYVNDHFSVIGTLNYLTAYEEHSILYLYYALMTFNFTPYITGMAIPHIYFKDYGKAKLFYPSIEKRIRIASLLHNIEQKLAVEQNLVKSLSVQKSYLLRMLFI